MERAHAQQTPCLNSPRETSQVALALDGEGVTGKEDENLWPVDGAEHASKEIELVGER